MNKTIEKIISNPSLLRKQWLPTEFAVREVVAYQKRFGNKHLKLACHLAFPLFLNREIVNLIRLNFLQQEEINWVAEVDFILSPLCQTIDNELFQVEPSIREVLLVELENEFGLERFFSLADFLQVYLNNSLNINFSRDIILTQRRIIQAYIEPEQLIEDLTNILNSNLSQTDYSSNIAEQIDLITILELVAIPLEKKSKSKKYKYLINNARILAQIIYGEEIEQKINSDNELSLSRVKKNEDLTEVSPSIAQQLLNIFQDTKIYLSKWLDDTIEEGWQAVDELLGFKTVMLFPSTRYFERDLDNIVCRATKISFDKQSLSISFALVTIVKASNAEQLNVSLKLCSLNKNIIYIPLDVEMFILNDVGQIINIKNSGRDTWIGCDITCCFGETFSVTITSNNENTTFDFVA